jgi:hypothetical protein
MVSGRDFTRIQIFPPAKPPMTEWPEKVPLVVRQDYTEACLIKDISPRASAALARRCLQGMIRDKYNVTMVSLNNEIQKVKKS